MRKYREPTTRVTATVTQILPTFGLAYLTADDRSSWAITKSTPGAGVAVLEPGTRVDLTVIHHPGFSLVSGYAPLI